MLQRFSCISFLFKPPWLYRCKKRSKVNAIEFGNHNVACRLFKLKVDSRLG